MTALTAETTYEIEVGLKGTYRPGSPEQGPTYASGGQPAEPDGVDDVEIVSFGLVRIVPAPIAERGSHPMGIWKTFNLLEGVDINDPAVQIILANVLKAMGQDEAERLLMNEVA